MRSLELAVNHTNDEQHQNRNDRNSDNAIRSHPSRHSPQSLNTPIHISLALQQIPMRVLNDIPLLMQIRERTRANLLRLQGYPLTFP